MVKRSFISSTIRNLSYIPGWRTKRHLVILESDDWGSIRMPSKEVFDNLINNGIDLLSDDGFIYNKYDSLATSDDLSSLFEILSSVKDCEGRSVVITPVSVVANPDFIKIRQSDFTDYIYEPITETLKKYNGCENSFILWKEGIEKRLFVPQFHGREHLNVNIKKRCRRLKTECGEYQRKLTLRSEWSFRLHSILLI
jgi:ribosomal protein L21E